LKSNSNLLLGYRFAFHDLLDPEVGYPPYSSLQILSLDFQKKSLDHLTFIEITNLIPWEDYEKPLSFHFDSGVTRSLDEKIRPYLAGGAGVSVHGFDFGNSIFYSLMTLYALGIDRPRLSIKPKVGLLVYPLKNRLALQLSYQAPHHQIKIDARLTINKTLSIAGSIFRDSQKNRKRQTQGEVSLAIYH
jgi:hypothetical protein